jgi:uncharacterized protein YcgL (UPF0745 family)
MNNICSIYRSPREEGMYLYVDKKNDLNSIPEELLRKFGKPELAMTLLITREKQLARVDAGRVLDEIKKNGFYLQMPPQSTHDMQWLRDKNSKL